MALQCVTGVVHVPISAASTCFWFQEKRQFYQCKWSIQPIPQIVCFQVNGGSTCADAVVPRLMVKSGRTGRGSCVLRTYTGASTSASSHQVHYFLSRGTEVELFCSSRYFEKCGGIQARMCAKNVIRVQTQGWSGWGPSLTQGLRERFALAF